MFLRTQIMLLKTVPAGNPLGYGGTFVTACESRIATLGIGYEDGLPRALSNRGKVIVRGQLAPIVGRVSMDLTLIDVTGVEGANVGDEVVVIGGQGSRLIAAEEVAGQAGTISYEVTCGISDRVPRVYIPAKVHVR
jgi:alanine racemase